MRCDKCKHWVKDKRNLPSNFNLGDCGYVMMFWDATEWGGQEGLEVVLNTDARDQKSFVQDGSDYTASLLTLGDFGCVKFEGKS